jgi:Golgi nucleoside diphosphatase
MCEKVSGSLSKEVLKAHDTLDYLFEGSHNALEAHTCSTIVGE